MNIKQLLNKLEEAEEGLKDAYQLEDESNGDNQSIKASEDIEHYTEEIERINDLIKKEEHKAEIEEGRIEALAEDAADDRRRGL